MKYSLRSLMIGLAKFVGHYWVEMGQVVFGAVGGILPVVILRPGVVPLLLIPVGWIVGFGAWTGVIVIACWFYDRKGHP